LLVEDVRKVEKKLGATFSRPLHCLLDRKVRPPTHHIAQNPIFITVGPDNVVILERKKRGKKVKYYRFVVVTQVHVVVTQVVVSFFVTSLLLQLALPVLL
jgi:hypothetical protein